MFSSDRRVILQALAATNGEALAPLARVKLSVVKFIMHDTCLQLRCQICLAQCSKTWQWMQIQWPQRFEWLLLMRNRLIINKGQHQLFNNYCHQWVTHLKQKLPVFFSLSSTLCAACILCAPCCVNVSSWWMFWGIAAAAAVGQSPLFPVTLK